MKLTWFLDTTSLLGDRQGTVSLKLPQFKPPAPSTHDGARVGYPFFLQRGLIADNPYNLFY